MSAPMCRSCCINRQMTLSYCKQRTFITQRQFPRIQLLRSMNNIPHEKIVPNQRNTYNSVFKKAAGSLSEFMQVRNLSAEDTANKMENPESRIILGIETSCDDTGAAVVDTNRNILGESINSQTKYHVKFGGVIPRVARNLHEENIHSVVQDALQRAQCTINDVDAIATTVKPGFTMSLNVGLDYAKTLVKQSGKPFIPIHHMEAHALTARLTDSSIEFPFLTLLLSGGHCLLALVRNVEDFILLGKGMDDAPGDAFDKTARRLKLRNIPEYSEMSGGQAIETLAQLGDPQYYDLVSVMSSSLNCNFSFSGIKTAMMLIIDEEEETRGLSPADILPNLPDICASFQYFVLHHIAKRLQRGFLFCHLYNLLPEHNRVLVVSGGVASNQFIRQGLERVCEEYDCRLVCPPPRLCTDNGVMIAWNGAEKLKRGLGLTNDMDSIEVQHRCPLGEDWIEKVTAAYISKMKRIKLL